jgi:hypothetical protein
MSSADRSLDSYEWSVETLIPNNIFNETFEDEDTRPDVGDHMSPQSTEVT